MGVGWCGCCSAEDRPVVRKGSAYQSGARGGSAYQSGARGGSAYQSDARGGSAYQSDARGGSAYQSPSDDSFLECQDTDSTLSVDVKSACAVDALTATTNPEAPGTEYDHDSTVREDHVVDMNRVWEDVIRFVWNSNQVERVGYTQRAEDVAECIRRCSGPHGRPQCKEDWETLGTYRAYVWMQNMRAERAADQHLPLVLTLDDLQTMHRLVMSDAAGPQPTSTFRRNDAYVREDGGGIHVFPAPHLLSKLMEGFVDDCNELLYRVGSDKSCRRDVAQWALFHLVSIHPWSDGNGRLARLLASWIAGQPVWISNASLYFRSLQTTREHHQAQVLIRDPIRLDGVVFGPSFV